MPSVVIMPGAFNPPTLAHLQIVQRLQSQLPNTPLVLLPAPRLPHKADNSLAPFAARCAMCALLLEGTTNTEISTFAASVVSVQTVDLLAAWRAAQPAQHVIWVLGADSFISLPQWQNWQELLSSTAFYVLARAGADVLGSQAACFAQALRVAEPQALHAAAGWYYDSEFNSAISATAARAGDNSLLLPAVADYMKQQGLYAQ